MRRTPSVDALIPALYLKGISTVDFSEALAAFLGEQASGLSATKSVRLKAGWENDYKVWCQRDLSQKRYVYWWADGIYFNVRLDEERSCEDRSMSRRLLKVYSRCQLKVFEPRGVGKPQQMTDAENEFTEPASEPINSALAHRALRAASQEGRFLISLDICYRFPGNVIRLMSRAGILFFALLLTTVPELRAEKIDNRNFAIDTYYPTPNEIQLAEQRARKYWAKHASRFGNNPFYLAVETSKIFPGEVQDLWVKLINSETTGTYFANRRTFSILYLKGIMIFDTRTGHFVSNREFIAVETPPLGGVARFDDYIARYIGFGNWP